MEQACPGAVGAGVVLHQDGRVASSFRWGFCDDLTSHNARLETATERPAWREAFDRFRLVLPLVTFMEGGAWFRHQEGSGLAVAGLYRRSNGGRRATMLTRPADTAVDPFHDRMPVILPADLIEPWLAGNDVDAGRLLAESPPLVTTGDCQPRLL